MADPTIPQPASPIRKRRRFRRLLTAVIVLTVLVVAGVIAVRIVLGGDLPRRIIVDRLQRATGLSVEVAEARVGWRGRTVLKDVVFRLPLDSQPLAAAPLIEVLHSPVHQIVASGDPGLQEISIMGASVDIREDHRGRWSPARAVSLVQAARQGTSQGSGPPLIPTLNISNSTVNVSRSGQAPVVLALVLKGQPIDAVSYAIDVMIGDSHLVGRVSTTDLDHAIEVKTANIEPLVKLFAGDVPSPIVIDATWDGSWNAGLAGELSIKTIRIGEGAATGRVSVSLQSGAMTARPVLLTISSPRLSRSPLTLSGGSVRLDSMAAIVESTRVQLPNLMTELSGEWRFGPRTGDASMTWTGREHEGRLVHQGKARLNATLPSTGPRTITAVVDSSGNTPEQSWRTQAKLEVTGLNWRNLRGAVEFPVLLVSDAEGPMDFSGLRAEALAKFPAISLTSLHLPGVRDLNASARFDMESLQWSLDASTASLALPRLAINPSVAVRASGDLERVEDFDVKAAIGERIVSAQGSYIPSRARPLAAHVELRSPIPPSADKVVSTHSGAAASLDIEGDVQPLSLHARGVLAAKDVKLRGRALTPIEIGISIDATREGVVFELPTFPICGGTAAAAGAFDARTNMIAARVRAESIDLKSAVELSGVSGSTTGTGSASIDIVLPALDVQKMYASGEWSVYGAAGAGWSVDEGHGHAGLAYPDLQVFDMHLNRGDGVMSGMVRIDVSQPTKLDVDVIAARWPLEPLGASITAEIDASARATIDLVAATARGNVQLSASGILEETTPARLALNIELDGRTAHAPSLCAELLGGTLSGSARGELDDWTSLTADLTISGLDLSRVAQLFPLAGDLRGTVDGIVTVKRTIDPVPLEPLQIDASLTLRDAAKGPLHIGDAHLRGYVGPNRYILQDASIELASGTLKAWSRLSFHDGEPFLHMSLQAEALELNQLFQAANPGAPPVAGQLSGPIILGGYVREPHRAYGDADISIEGSEIGRLPIVSDLYGLLKLDFSNAKAEGTGKVRLRLEGDRLEVARIQYFNAGVDMLGTARIENIWLGGESQFSGSFAAVARPLKDSALPLSAGLDRLLTALLDDAVSVRVDGTLSAPRTRVVPFAEVSSGIRRVFGIGKAEPD